MELVHIPSAPRRCSNLVFGAFKESRAGRIREVLSPYTGKAVATVELSDSRDVDEAVGLAAQAFPKWARTPIKERTELLFALRGLLLRDIDSLAHLAASESGKTVAEAKAGIQKGIEVLEFALSLQNLDIGGRMEVSRGVWCEYKREPLGVVAGITPFNFPAMVPMWMFPIALALGNCFVLKPSEKVPSAMTAIGRLTVEAGFPPGVFSIVHGDREVVEALCDHPVVRAVGFVGSTPVARSVYARASASGKRALCLGGAKNHLIVVPDADPSITVKAVVDSFTGCAGQRCMAASVLVAVGSVDELIDQIRVEAAGRSLGSVMGAIIDSDSVSRIRASIARAIDEGARVLLDGRSVAAPTGYEGGFWLAPTILDGAGPEMECARRELFGPVLTIVRVNTLSEALALDADSPFGNATSVFTTSGAVASEVAAHATSGMIGINVGVPVPREPFSFGGTKESKFGQGDITGVSSLDLWSNLKKVTTKWTSQKENWMS